MEGRIIADCFIAIMPPGIGNKKVQQLRLARKKLVEKRKLARENSQSGGHALPEVPLPESLPRRVDVLPEVPLPESLPRRVDVLPEVPLPESLLRRVDVEDDDPDCDHSTGDSRTSGNEDSGSESGSDSEVEMADAEGLDL